MRKISTFAAIIALAFLFAGTSIAQNLFTENFNTTAGTAVVGYNSWAIVGTSTTNPVTVSTTGGATGLSYTGYTGSGVGLSVVLTNSGQDCNHTFTAVTTGSVYASAMVNVTAALASGDYFFHFSDGGSFNFYAKTMVRANGSGFDFGIGKRSNATATSSAGGPVWTSTPYTVGQTYLVVIKYTFFTASSADTLNDEVDLFVNPTLGSTEPTPTLTTTDAGGTAPDATTISAIHMRQGTASQAPTLIIDGIQVGTSWASIAGITPVELTSFTAVPSKGAVNLSWNTATEVNNMGFNVERSANKTDWTKIAFVQGNQTSTKPIAYSYVDNSVSQSGKYYYRLKQVDNDGTFKYSSIAEVDVNSPSVFSLNQNYPNPFNPSTIISYSLPMASNVKLIVYNSIGQPVSVLENGFKNSGSYNVTFNASELSSGIYFCKIEAGQFSQIRKMMLLK